MLRKRAFYITLISFLLLGAMLLSSCNGDAKPTEPAGDDGGTEASSNDGGSEGGETNKNKKTDKEGNEVKELVITPISYNVDVIKTADKTAAGSFEAWKNEVDKPSGAHNNDPTTDSVIKSPFHTLTVNGKKVEVYTARCGEGAHSFAWIDVSTAENLELELKLTLSESFGKCVVLPESRNDETSVAQKTVTSKIKEVGSYTYTFAKSASAEITDPTFAPLTVMISEESNVKFGKYKTVNIEPGFHEENELEFKQGQTVYVFKAGFHDICSIGLPSDSILYIEPGAYLKVTERKGANNQYNKKYAIHTEDTDNVRIISRGLLDCGALIGGDDKNKGVVFTARSRYVTIEGLTIINSNTWTICAYSGENININKNLLLSYRMYSDGIMMSECVNSAGRYNFVRTGDDAIEFKGTGWNSGNVSKGNKCVYEYNDIWTDKGAGYCLTWENNSPMDEMVFKNNSIGFALAAWTRRTTAIDCLLGINAYTKWSNVTFENIEIYRVNSQSVIAVQIGKEEEENKSPCKGGILENITFKNITVKSVGSTAAGDTYSTYAFRMYYRAEGGSISNIAIENMTFCGKKLTAADKSNSALFNNKASAFWSELTVS